MATEITKYVIDACALIAYFRGEQGDKLRELFKEQTNIIDFLCMLST